MNPFWCVWNPDGRAPMHRHSTESLARMEAKRLASSNPGQEFFVLAAVGVAQKVDVEYKTICQDNIPF